MEHMSTSTPEQQAGPPYQVERQEHHVRFHPDGTTRGEYTVHIKHRNGTKTQFTVPESSYTAPLVHQMAMSHVQAVEQVAGLPMSLPPNQRQIAAPVPPQQAQ